MGGKDLPVKVLLHFTFAPPRLGLEGENGTYKSLQHPEESELDIP